MTSRVWAGAGAAVASVVGLGGYLAVVGLDDADKIASVLGLFVAVAGLAVAVWGLILERRGGDRPAVEEPQNLHLRAEASGQSRVYQAGRDINVTER